MSADTQQRVIAFLSRPEAYGPVPRVERIDTHISVVFLAGTRAYKLKRAVRYPYLDYSTLELRREACERELRLNRRTAPALYRAVIAVTRESGGRLALGGAGEPVEWLVEMNRFDEAELFDRLASTGRLDVPLARQLAAEVARFHEGAQPRRDHGGEAAMSAVVDGNLEEMLADPAALDRGACLALHEASRAAIARHAVLIEARRMHGLVRQCHGDLHLRNVFLSNGTPTLFDAIEFNDAIACVDMMYDLAFLLMDLWHRGLPRQANAVLNAWLEERRDYRGLTLLPLYLSCRAAVRAKVSVAAAATLADDAAAERLRGEARAYLALASAVIRPAPPHMIAIGGFSGSGKSTLAAALAPSLGAAPGAIVVRSDVIRKDLFGVDRLQRLPARAYEPAVTAIVYARALHAAEACLRSGHAVVVDAVFGDPRHRRAVEWLAREVGVPFDGLWVEVPRETAVRRLVDRRADPSDATAAVLERQLRSTVGRIEWRRIDGRGFAPDGIVDLGNLPAPAGVAAALPARAR